ncbi:MAG: toxin-antitoxin system protein [Prevotella sp.]|nr:toxin-antitoxin system protein [Prevotella sp.]
MEHTTLRQPASFRLRSDLLEAMKERAKASHRSLNNLVESILLDAMYSEPNKETLEAMQEAHDNKGGAYSNVSALMKSLAEE